MSAGRIAILIDGGFFLERLPKWVAVYRCESPGKIVACIRHLCRNHVKMLTGAQISRWQKHVYRIFFYDAVPYDGKAHHPIDNRPIDFGKSNVAQDRNALFELLRKERKLALDRLGAAPDPGTDASPTALELSAEEARSLIELRELCRSLDGGAVSLGLRQKGVDMRIGLAISTLTFKRQVDTIILVAGDSDFVPVAKLARREGIEFILDPLWQQVNADLFEHIDGLQSGLKRPGNPVHKSENGAQRFDFAEATR